MADKTLITNVSGQPRPLPPPFLNTPIQAGAIAVVTGSRAAINALLGGDAAMSMVWRTAIGNPTQPATHDPGLVAPLPADMAQTIVAAEVYAANQLAQAMLLENDSAATFYGRWIETGTAVSSTVRSFSLAPGERQVLEVKFATLRLIGVWDAAGAGTLRVTRA